MGFVFLMVAVSILPHAKFGQNDDRELWYLISVMMVGCVLQCNSCVLLHTVALLSQTAVALLLHCCCTAVALLVHTVAHCCTAFCPRVLKLSPYEVREIRVSLCKCKKRSFEDFLCFFQTELNFLV